MEVKNIHTHAGWFASYMNAPDGGNDAQGQALVECQSKKIKQLQEVLELIVAETELVGEFNSKMIIESIKTLAEKVPDVEHAEGYFKWVG